MSNRQFESDFTNPDFYQREENYYSDAAEEEFYHSTAEPVPHDYSAGISPNRVEVARALVLPVLKGHVNWRDGSLQERKDAIYYTARHDNIKFAGVPEEWLDETYVADIDELLTQLIEHCS